MISAMQTPTFNRPNSLRAAPAAKQRQIGSWLAMGDPYLAEMNTTAGFDWLLVDDRHAPSNMRATLAQPQAMAPYHTEPIVRPYSGDPALIERLLDIGARTLLVSMVDTAKQARDLMRAVRCPPFGTRGVSSAAGRASHWSVRINYLQVTGGEVCLFIRAEIVIALQSLEAICAMDGVDGVFTDPTDLAVSMGYHGNAGHPEVRVTIDSAMRMIIMSGKAAGTLTSDPMPAHHYLGLGCVLVATGIDVLLFVNGAHKLTRDFTASQTA